jgi:methyltransferase
MLASPTALVVLFAFTLSRVVELRVHRTNRRRLIDAGADERHRILSRTYVAATVAVAPLALLEALPSGLLGTRLPELATAGLLAAGLGVGLRCWAIASLGPLWTLGCLSLPGLRATNRGPYRWLSHPEFLARWLEGLGIALVLGAVETAAAYAIVAGLAGAVLARLEAAQLSETAALGGWRPEGAGRLDLDGAIE